MEKAPARVYADTSVFGGVFDEEFTTASESFFEQARPRSFQLVVSDVIRKEIADAPQPVRACSKNDSLAVVNSLSNTPPKTDVSAYTRVGAFSILFPPQTDFGHAAQRILQ